MPDFRDKWKQESLCSAIEALLLICEHLASFGEDHIRLSHV
jgi:hypothetical protein